MTQPTPRRQGKHGPQTPETRRKIAAAMRKPEAERRVRISLVVARETRDRIKALAAATGETQGRIVDDAMENREK